jgi:hypothetical protein
MKRTSFYLAMATDMILDPTNLLAGAVSKLGKIS